MPALRIGLISDTHEAPDPVALVEQLRRLHCDFNIHLGDIGGSYSSSLLVREYKENARILEGLTPDQRAEYDSLVASGERGVIAWLHVTVGDDPEEARRRRRETAESYDAVVAAMKSLPNLYFVAGNVERIVGRGELVRHCFRHHGLELIEHPRLVEAGSASLVLWPSPRKEDLPGITCKADELAAEIKRPGPVLVLAHEQLFRGPVPAVYRARVEATGRLPRSIPYYEPNPAGPAILRFLRLLPRSIRIGMLHGHIHDGNDVIQAGVTYMRPAPGKGLWLRLYGVGRMPGEEGPRHPGLRRAVTSYGVPTDGLVVVTIEGEDYRIEMA